MCLVPTWCFPGGCVSHPLQSLASSTEPGRQGLQSAVGEWMDRWPDYGGFTVTEAFLALVQVSKVVGDTRL